MVSSILSPIAFLKYQLIFLTHVHLKYIQFTYFTNKCALKTDECNISDWKRTFSNDISCCEQKLNLPVLVWKIKVASKPLICWLHVCPLKTTFSSLSKDCTTMGKIFSWLSPIVRRWVVPDGPTFLKISLGRQRPPDPTDEKPRREVKLRSTEESVGARKWNLQVDQRLVAFISRFNVPGALVKVSEHSGKKEKAIFFYIFVLNQIINKVVRLA